MEEKKSFGAFVKTAAKFVGSGLVSWLVDYFALLGLHALFVKDPPLGLDPKLTAIVIARIMSSLVNYFLNRRAVFRDGNRLSILLYYATVAVLLGANWLLLRLFTGLGIPLWLAQIIAQVLIYPVSFIIQKKVVFRKKKEE